MANSNEAMREALVKIKDINDRRPHDAAGYEINDIIDAALAAPPRNCDRYSHDEALRVWSAEKENERNGCFDEWLYNEFEPKGESDGSK